MKSLFDTLKESPLANNDASIEEIAIWLDLNGFSTAKKIYEILNAIDDNRLTFNDYVHRSIFFLSPGTGKLQYKPIAKLHSDNILSNLFKAIVHANALCSIVEVKLLLKLVEKGKCNCKKKLMKHHTMASNSKKWKYNVIVDDNALKATQDMFEAYGELQDALKKMLNDA